MEFEVGKLYRGINNIVKCISNVGATTDHFTGVLYNIDRGSLTETLICKNNWEKCRFKPYTEPKETVITLQNGHKYSIPKGCKATVTGDVIEIEEDVRYFYHKSNGCTGYYKNMTDTTMEVVFYDDGDISISTSNIFDWSERSTKEEFETAYNKAMEVLKL